MRKLLLLTAAILTLALLFGCTGVNYHLQTVAESQSETALWASLPPTPSPEPTLIPSLPPVAKGTGTVVNCEEFVYVRTGPGETYDVAQTLYKGARVSVMELTPANDWYTLLIDGQQMYIHKEYFAVDVDATPTPTTTPIVTFGTALISSRMGTVINCEESINTRSGPGYSYAEAVSLDKGARVKVLGTFINDEWHKIEVGGYPAYIHKDYLEIDPER